MTLTIENGTPITVEGGAMLIEHGCVLLKRKDGPNKWSTVFAYKLKPGESLRRGEHDNYTITL